MITILNKTTARENMMALFPELDGARRGVVDARQLREANPEATDAMLVQMAVSGNTLNPTSAALWGTVAANAIDAATKRYVDLKKFAYAAAPSMPLPLGVLAPIHVPVIDSAGDVLTDTTDWDKTALNQKYVTVLGHRKSRPAALDSYDLAQGERVEQKIAACVESVVAGCWAALGAAVAGALPTTQNATTAATKAQAGIFKVDSSAWGPEVVAKQLSTLYGDYGQPDVLALSPSLYGSIVPTTALSLNPETAGVYGIGSIGQGAGLAACAADGAGKGFVCRRGAIAVGTMLPDLSDFTGIATRYLGEVGGIPLLLKVWSSDGTETLRFSVETVFGATVAAPQFLTVLV